MKLIKLVQAYKDLEKLADIEEYKQQEQWKLYQLRKELKQHIEFFKEREEKINKKYVEFIDETGTLKGQKYIEYLKEKADLENMDIETHIEKTELPLSDGVNFKTIESLEDFIEFTI